MNTWEAWAIIESPGTSRRARDRQSAAVQAMVTSLSSGVPTDCLHGQHVAVVRDRIVWWMHGPGPLPQPIVPLFKALGAGAPTAFGLLTAFSPAGASAIWTLRRGSLTGQTQQLGTPLAA